MLKLTTAQFNRYYLLIDRICGGSQEVVSEKLAALDAKLAARVALRLAPNNHLTPAEILTRLVLSLYAQHGTAGFPDSATYVNVRCSFARRQKHLLKDLRWAEIVADNKRQEQAKAAAAIVSAAAVVAGSAAFRRGVIIEFRPCAGPDDTDMQASRGVVAETKVIAPVKDARDFWQAVMFGWKMEERGARRDAVAINDIGQIIGKQKGKGRGKKKSR